MVAGDLLLHGEKTPSPLASMKRMGGARSQSPQQVVAVDRDGVVRHAQRIGHSDTLPTVGELLSVLAPLRTAVPSASPAG